MRAREGSCNNPSAQCVFAPSIPLKYRLGVSFMEESTGDDKGHVTEATQLMAGLGTRALGFKPEEAAFPPHGDSNKRQSHPRARWTMRR